MNFLEKYTGICSSSEEFVLLVTQGHQEIEKYFTCLGNYEQKIMQNSEDSWISNLLVDFITAANNAMLITVPYNHLSPMMMMTVYHSLKGVLPKLCDKLGLSKLIMLSPSKYMKAFDAARLKFPKSLAEINHAQKEQALMFYLVRPGLVMEKKKLEIEFKKALEDCVLYNSAFCLPLGLSQQSIVECIKIADQSGFFFAHTERNNKLDCQLMGFYLEKNDRKEIAERAAVVENEIKKLVESEKNDSTLLLHLFANLVTQVSQTMESSLSQKQAPVIKFEKKENLALDTPIEMHINHPSGAKLVLRQGSICQVQAEAIVNSTDLGISPDNMGPVCRAICNEAGSSYMQAYQNIPTNQKLQGITLQKGNLTNCEKIITIVPVSQRDAVGVGAVLEMILKQVELHMIKSFAVPFVGTGQGKFGTDDIPFFMDKLYLAFESYPCLKNITVCDLDLAKLKIAKEWMISKKKELTKAATLSMNKNKNSVGGYYEFQWWDEDQRCYKQYDRNINRKFNEALQRGESSIELNISGVNYLFDLNGMTQINQKTNFGRKMIKYVID